MSDDKTDDLHRLDCDALRERLQQMRPARVILDCLVTVTQAGYIGLTEWEANFVYSLVTRYRIDAQLSEKQAAKARDVIDKAAEAQQQESAAEEEQMDRQREVYERE